jgi:hypothetical protein
MLAFNDFLEFEWKIYGSDYPIATYDAALIRYGEYRFVLESVPFHCPRITLDLRNEHRVGRLRAKKFTGAFNGIRYSVNAFKHEVSIP